MADAAFFYYTLNKQPTLLRTPHHPHSQPPSESVSSPPSSPSSSSPSHARDSTPPSSQRSITSSTNTTLTTSPTSLTAPRRSKPPRSAHGTLPSTAATATKHGAATMTDRKHPPAAGDASHAALLHRASAHPHDLNYRTGSVSSTSGTLSASLVNSATSGEASASEMRLAQPFTRRWGRRILSDPTLPYPFPCDIVELHRQILRTMVMCQLFGGPFCNPTFRHRPPRRVLEVGCGSGIWSSMCYQHFAKLGHTSISFTGLDVAPLAPDLGRDQDMMWRLVLHDLRRLPLPFSDGEFDFIMVKDCSGAVNSSTVWQHTLMEEYIRILRPGGVLEIWDSDHAVRILLPHQPPLTTRDGGTVEEEDLERALATGSYLCTLQTPFTAADNEYLSTYNTWLTKAFQRRSLPPSPLTAILPVLHQESELVDVDMRRIAIPLGDEVRWEKEGVGGVSTDATAGRGREPTRKVLTAEQSALRQTVLLTVVQKIESLEPFLREANGIQADEWDRWHANMMNSLLRQRETTFGECVEFGAFWGRKVQP